MVKFLQNYYYYFFLGGGSGGTAAKVKYTPVNQITHLQTIHSLAVLTPAVDPLQVVFPASPVVLDGVNIFDDGWVESPVE